VVDWRIKQSMSVAEMVMLRWNSGVTKKDSIRNKCGRANISVASIVDEVRKNKLKPFRNVIRKVKTEALRAVMRMSVGGRRRRPKKNMFGYD